MSKANHIRTNYISILAVELLYNRKPTNQILAFLTSEIRKGDWVQRLEPQPEPLEVIK